MISDRLAEAIYSWYGPYFDEFKEKHNDEFYKQIIDRFKLLGISRLKVQFEMFSNLIRGLVDIRKYETANKLMERIAKELYPRLLF